MDSQLPHFTAFHFKVSICFQVTLAAVALWFIFAFERYLQASIISILMILNAFQMVYFRYKPSTHCLTIVNTFNVLFTFIRIFEALEPKNPAGDDPRFYFFEGTVHMCLHLTLLISQTFLPNVIVLTLVFLITFAGAQIENTSSVTPISFAMIPAISVFLYKQYIDIIDRRNLYLATQKYNKWGTLDF